MVVKNLQIDIIDTFDNDRLLVLENTEIGSPSLIYNGFEDKFMGVMSSELHFNMLVKSNLPATFYHLLTGSETRYRVELVDVSDGGSVKLWTGFLLPEHFVEPYDKPGFFVDFVATDGIGRIKGKKLKTDFYRGKKRVLEVLNACLEKTGLFFPIYFAPAIVNKYAEVSFNDLIVNTSSYVDDDDYLSAYDVLKKIVESLCCTLFQYKNAWYVIGLNNLEYENIVFQKYGRNYNGDFVFKGDVRLTRERFNKKFLSSPVVSVIPPIKELEVVWDASNRKTLLPEDVVTAYPLNYDQNREDRTVNYWDSSSSNMGLSVFMYYHSENSFFSPAVLEGHLLVDGSNNLSSDGELVYGPYVSFGVTNESDYIEYNRPFFIQGSSLNDVVVDLDVDLAVIGNLVGSDKRDRLKRLIDEGVFQGSFKWALVRKGEDLNGVSVEGDVVFSNFHNSSNAVNSKFGYDVSVSSDSVYKCSLSLEALPVVKSGYYTIRFYGVSVSDFFWEYATFVFKKVSLKINLDKSLKFKTYRDIDYTTKFSKSLFHNFSLASNSDRKISIDLSGLSLEDSFVEDKWRLTNFDKVGTYESMVALLYQYLTQVPVLKVSGVLLSLVFPLDLLVFKFVSGGLFSLTGLKLDLTEGVSEVNYVQQLDGGFSFVDDEGVYSIIIDIEGNGVKSLSDQDFWVVDVSYDVHGFQDVDAVLEINQLTDSPDLGGVRSGFGFSNNIRSVQGVSELKFSFPLPVERYGWYEVVMYQDDVVSNVEYVQVAMFPKILLKRYETDDFLEWYSKCMVKPVFENFTPKNAVFEIKRYYDKFVKPPVNGSWWKKVYLETEVISVSSLFPDEYGYYNIDVKENQGVEVVVKDGDVVSNLERAYWSTNSPF